MGNLESAGGKDIYNVYVYICIIYDLYTSIKLLLFVKRLLKVCQDWTTPNFWKSRIFIGHIKRQF